MGSSEKHGCGSHKPGAKEGYSTEHVGVGGPDTMGKKLANKHAKHENMSIGSIPMMKTMATDPTGYIEGKAIVQAIL